MLRESPGSNSDFVASDNLLYPRTFDLVCYESQYHPTLADDVRMAITRNLCCNEANDSMHEAVFGVPIPTPIHTANIYNVNKTWISSGCCNRPPWTNYTVYYENHNGTGILSDAQYGDVAAYTALELERRGDHAGALHEIAVLNWMYDGRGIADDVFRYGANGERGIYQTFKDALYILALAKTGQWIPHGLEKTILSMQGPDGGFHTGYDSTGNYAGTKENVETTTLAMLALHSLPAKMIIEDFSYHDITGSGPVRKLFVSILFENNENWTVDVNVTVYWDNTTLIGTEYVRDVSNSAQTGGFCYHCIAPFNSSIPFDPTVPHFLFITVGNSTHTLQVYSPPSPSPPPSPPWWIAYWFLIPIPIPAIATLVLFALYRTRSGKTKEHSGSL